MNKKIQRTIQPQTILPKRASWLRENNSKTLSAKDFAKLHQNSGLTFDSKRELKKEKLLDTVLSFEYKGYPVLMWFNKLSQKKESAITIHFEVPFGLVPQILSSQGQDIKSRNIIAIAKNQNSMLFSITLNENETINFFERRKNNPNEGFYFQLQANSKTHVELASNLDYAKFKTKKNLRSLIPIIWQDRTQKHIERNAQNLAEQITINRDITLEEDRAKYFLDLEAQKHIDSMQIPGMQAVYTKIQKTIQEQKQITIYGDYDVDGVSSTALLYKTLKRLGANVNYFIPTREQGYGLSQDALQKLLSQSKPDLIITCDCGNTQIQELKNLQRQGIDLAILDHHSISKQEQEELNPLNITYTNPSLIEDSHHPLKNLAAVGVVYKLVEMLLKNSVPENLMHLSSLGTVADLVPQLGENRVITRQGLKTLLSTNNIGLQSLINSSINKKKFNKGFFSAEDISFDVGPKINAAGRMSTDIIQQWANDRQRQVFKDYEAKYEETLSYSATDVLRLLLLEDTEEAKAQDLAHVINTYNEIRKKIQDEISQYILDQLQYENSKIEALEKKSIVLCDKDLNPNNTWPHSIVGIIASQVMEAIPVPIILGSVQGDYVKFSARSSKYFGIDLAERLKAINAIYKKEKGEDLVYVGGHKYAAGGKVAISKWQDFQKYVENYLYDSPNVYQVKKIFEYDRSLSLFDFIDKNLSLKHHVRNALETTAPYGNEFEKPSFKSKELKIKTINITKSKRFGESHANLILQESDHGRSIEVKAMLWRRARQLEQELSVGDKAEFLFSIEEDPYSADNKVQINIIDWKKSTEEKSVL